MKMNLKSLALILIIAVFGINCACYAGTITITRPPVVARFFHTIDIEKVEITDTATLLYLKSFTRPGTVISIPKNTTLTDENERIYQLKHSSGVSADEKLTVPKTGEADFRLIFPPLPKGTASFNLFCGGNKMWGIQLDEKSFRKSLLSFRSTTARNTSDTILPEPELKFGEAILKGKLLGFTKGMPQTGQLYLLDPVRGMGYDEELSIEPDGSFHLSPKVITATPAVIVFPFATIKCLLAPSQETLVTINVPECTRRKSRLLKDTPSYGERAYFKGYLSGLQQELLDKDLPCNLVANTPKIIKDMEGKDLNEYKDYIFQNRLNTYKKIEKAHLSNAASEILKKNTDITAAIALLMGKDIIKRATINARKMTSEEQKEYLNNTKIEFPDNYFQFMKQLELNVPKAVYTSEYFYGISIFSAYKELLESLLGTSKGMLFDMLDAHNCFIPITKLTPLTQKQEAILGTLSSPAYKQLADSYNSQLLKQLEAKKNKTGIHIYTIGKESRNEQLFKDITSRFKGHTLLIDFWATWCAPCRQANQEIANIKEELKRQGIIFVYLTGETSPIQIWENTILGIPGEHFRLSDKQWKDLLTKFKIPGIPFYVVVTPKGNVTYTKAGFPGNDTIKDELTKAMGK